jgi:hypothetical protein
MNDRIHARRTAAAAKANRNLLLAALLAAGGFVRVWTLQDYAPNTHEMQFLNIARADTLAEVFRRSLFEVHPPLLYMLRHYLLLLAPGLFVHRLLSVAAGLLSVFGVYRVGLLLRGEAVGLFSALFMSFFAIEISDSMMLRDYVFFTPPMLGAFYYFIRYRRGLQRRDLAGFAVLTFLAAAMNFSGFLVAAACGFDQGLRLLKARKLRDLAVFCLSYVPLALQAAAVYVFFMAPGTSGPMWERMFRINGLAFDTPAERLPNTLEQAFLLFVPFAGLPGLGAMGPWWLRTGLLLAGTLAFLALEAFGLRRIAREEPALGRFILILWLVALAASLAGIYAFSASRHVSFLLPFLILPLGYALEPLAAPALHARKTAVGAAAAILAFGLALGGSGLYPGFEDELSLKNAELSRAQDILARKLAKGDVIVTGKVGAYFYLLDAKDGGKTPYDSYGDIPDYHGARVFAPFDPPFAAHEDWRSFRASVAARFRHGDVAPGARVWFVMYGWQSDEILRLFACPALRPELRDFYSRPGVLMFNVAGGRFAAFLKDQAAWTHCFEGEAPRDNAVPFPAFPPPGPQAAKPSKPQ